MPDRIEVPKPLRRDVHRDSGGWARGSGSWEWTIVEREFDNLLFISGSTKPVEHSWLVGDYLTGLIALRVSEGWAIISANETSATLMKVGNTVTYDGNKLVP